MRNPSTLQGQTAASSRTLPWPGVGACAILLAATACAVFGQSTATPKLEVASIKPLSSPEWCLHPPMARAPLLAGA
jgi:hypothetical protein